MISVIRLLTLCFSPLYFAGYFRGQEVLGIPEVTVPVYEPSTPTLNPVVTPAAK